MCGHVRPEVGQATGDGGGGQRLPSRNMPTSTKFRRCRPMLDRFRPMVGQVWPGIGCGSGPILADFGEPCSEFGSGIDRRVARSDKFRPNSVRIRLNLGDFDQSLDVSAKFGLRSKNLHNPFLERFGRRAPRLPNEPWGAAKRTCTSCRVVVSSLSEVRNGGHSRSRYETSCCRLIVRRGSRCCKSRAGSAASKPPNWDLSRAGCARVRRNPCLAQKCRRDFRALCVTLSTILHRSHAVYAPLTCRSSVAERKGKDHPS